MPLPKLTRLELQIMEALWSHGACSVREIQESFPAKKRPAYTTVQTTVYRLEVKKALRRVKKISTANIFEAAVSREAAERRLIDDLLGLFGGRSRGAGGRIGGICSTHSRRRRGRYRNTNDLRASYSSSCTHS